MYPVRALSFYNGCDILFNQKTEVWQTIKDTLLELSMVVSGEKKTVRQMATLGTSKLKITELSEAWQNLYHKHSDWNKEGFLFSSSAASFLDYTESYKDRVYIKLAAVSTDTGGNMSKFIFVDSPRAAREAASDLTVLLVPENGVTKLFGTPREIAYDFPFTESACRKQLDELLPIPYGSPLAIIFFSQHYHSLEFSYEEMPILIENKNDSVIERVLEFAPEYTQAGIGVLSYFGEVLHQKYPGLDVKVRIEQQGTKVLMHVELPSGDIDTIQEELATYFLVASGKEKPEALLTNPYHVMALENKLQMANMELRMAHQLAASLNNDITDLKASQQRMEATFREQIAEQGTQIRMLTALATQQTVSHERIQLAQIGHAGTMFTGLLTQAQGSQAALMAIRNLEHNLLSGLALMDVQEQITAALTTIKQEKPSLLQHLAGQIEGAGFGAVGGFVLDWISKHPFPVQ